MRITELFRKLKTGIYRDFILSLLASVIMTAVAQFVLNPVYARICSAEQYGQILTIVGVGNVIILAFGGSLNNVRIVMNADYETDNLEGDFLPILSVMVLLGTVLYCVYSVILEKSFIIIVLLSGFALFGILQNYGSVAFRIKIDYVKNLWLCVWISVGNLVGLVILYLTKEYKFWATAYVIGQLFGAIYIITRSKIFREKFVITPLFKRTINKTSILFFTTLCANILVYLDRLLLYPLLGSEAVSIYSVSSFFGKSLAILMTPISGVLLSYYGQKDYKMSLKSYWRINLITLAISLAFIIISLFISEWVTGILYPTLIQMAKPYLFVANVTAVIVVIGNMVTPAILKYASTVWVALNQIVYMIIYLGLGILLSKRNGLLGFSYAALIAAFIRVCIFYIVGHVSIKRTN